MFGDNKVTHPREYANQASNMLSVVSVFLTHQGEGPYAGRPAFFIRLRGCNLQCVFCDTNFDTGADLRIRDLPAVFSELMNSADAPAPTLAVITGGEPLLQPSIGTLCEYLYKELGLTVQLESNGTHYEPLPSSAALLVSPKIVRNGSLARPPQAILARANYMKILVDTQMAGYQELPDWLHEWAHYHGRERVYLAPMSVYARKPDKSPDDTPESRADNEVVSFWTPGLFDHVRMQDNHEHAARQARHYGFCLTHQMHLFASIA